MKLPNAISLIIGFSLALLIRLLPFRPPNVEPILAIAMPFAKRNGPITGFLFGFLSIVLFDLTVGRAGVWTFITAGAYGVLGGAAAFYLSRFTKRRHYVYFAILGTLFYDAVTGLSIGPLFFNQPFWGAVVGQIPFTASHLAGSVLFALGLSPLIEHILITQEKRLEIPIGLPSSIRT